MKDVIIAVLTAYVVLDIGFQLILRRNRPMVFKHAFNVARRDKTRMLIVFVLAIAAGMAAYYTSVKTSDCD